MIRSPRRLAPFRACCAAIRVLVASAVLAPLATAVAAPKTDVIHLGNGDRLTGEIKHLDKGRLELSTDSLGTVYIEWDKIVGIETSQYLHVETRSGSRFLGKVPKEGASGTMRLLVEGEPEGQVLAMADVVRIDPIEQGRVFKRLDGYVTAGFSYAKADNRTQFNFSGGVSSRTEERKWTLDGATTVNTDSSNTSSSMYDVTLSDREFRRNRWFLEAFGTVQGNDELGLNIREIVGGGIGRYLVQNQSQEWAAAVGLAGVRENFESESAQNSLEAVLATDYAFFVYDTPKRSLDFALAVFPSLTQSGRVRSEANLDGRLEIVKDLFLDLTLYGSYDSQADQADPAASNVDYGIVTSLGYSF